MTSIRKTATESFECELEDLILSSFARSAAIEGEWKVDVPVSSAPDWTIIIEKHANDSKPTYEPTLLEE